MNAEMANRTNKPNRIFSRPCSVCSSSAPLRTEPNNALVRFVFGRFSNINTLVRFCSNRTRTEQYLCSVRVLQVRTKPSKVKDHMKHGYYLKGKSIQWVSRSTWASLEWSRGETEGGAQKTRKMEDEGHWITCITVWEPSRRYRKRRWGGRTANDDRLDIGTVGKPGGSDCRLEVICNSNIILDLFATFSRTSRTNSNRTDHCSVRVHLEQNFLGRVIVRFETNTNRTGGLFGSAASEQWPCSVRPPTEQTEQTRTCTVRQAISAIRCLSEHRTSGSALQTRTTKPSVVPTTHSTTTYHCHSKQDNNIYFNC